jgi:hypothetical protein
MQARMRVKRNEAAATIDGGAGHARKIRWLLTIPPNPMISNFHDYTRLPTWKVLTVLIRQS